MVPRAKEESPLGDGRRGHTGLTRLIDTQQFEFRPGLYDKHIAVLGREIDPSFRGHGRTGEGGSPRPESLPIEQPSGFRIAAAQDPSV